MEMVYLNQLMVEKIGYQKIIDYLTYLLETYLVIPSI